MFTSGTRGRTDDKDKYLVRAETFFYRGKPAFVRTEDLKDERVDEWWVFEKWPQNEA